MSSSERTLEIARLEKRAFTCEQDVGSVLFGAEEQEPEFLAEDAGGLEQRGDRGQEEGGKSCPLFSVTKCTPGEFLLVSFKRNKTMPFKVSLPQHAFPPKRLCVRCV